MNIFTKILIIIFCLPQIYCVNECSFYALDPISCVELVKGHKCYYNYFENMCVETKLDDIGCQNYFNYDTCIYQKKRQDDSLIQCLFDKRCRDVNSLILKTYGCDSNLSKYACLNTISQKCQWNEVCEEIQSYQVEYKNCEEIYKKSVNSLTCSSIQNIACLNGGIKNDYHCLSILEEDYLKINCDEFGLSMLGCIQIKTIGQTCVFQNGFCKFIEPETIESCDQAYNINACLSDNKKKLLCEWENYQCREFQHTRQICNQLSNVNQYVCLQQDLPCQYDKQNFKCIDIDENQYEKLSCDTSGISKEGCLRIKNSKCSFYKGYCQEIGEIELEKYSCEMDLNEDACVNIQTHFQYCQWNGVKCQRIFINQDFTCQSIDDKIKYNGNVCKQVSSVPCKYNKISKTCILAEPLDSCDAQYLNMLGCVSIENSQTCQWTTNGCKRIVIYNFKTTCDSLGNANPQSCSQVFENYTMGCYFKKDSLKCQSLQLDEDENKQEVIDSIQILNSIGCEDSSFGWNKIACASMRIKGQACRWSQNKCSRVKIKEDIQNIPCMFLQFSNQYTCSMVQYGGDICRYQYKGCVNSMEQDMKCSNPGLNSFACSQISGKCFYNNEYSECQEIISSSSSTSTSQDVQALSLTSLDTLQCILSFPSKDICVQILTIGQQCQWSYRLQTCSECEVLHNKKCTYFSGIFFLTNPNVCASVTMDFPNYDYIYGPEFDVSRGYCKYNSIKKNCDIKTDNCTTKCCTELQDIGINAHSCSRFSNQDPGVYCYFNNYRCQELTSFQVDITNEEDVKKYYNQNYFKCNQMNINSCHMIEWSTQQRCYHDSLSCNNVNFDNYLNLEIFTQYPAILNVYACLSIEAKTTIYNSLKYFEYDPIQKFCIPKEFTSETPYQNCEDVKGNSNICLRYTGNLYCKWDSKNLKCVTITQEELQEINTCDYNQNIKACIEIKNVACQFSNDFDKCINAPLNVDCLYFDKSGKISDSVCKSIVKSGQVCEFSNYLCKISNNSYSQCYVSNGNKYGCFSQTNGQCRWDPQSLSCYENQTIYKDLKCQDNLNRILCVLVQNYACMWDENMKECVEFPEKMTSTNFQKLNELNLYTVRACLQISEAGYKFDKAKNKCVLMSETEIFDCEQSTIQVNDYACLVLTKGYRCYYDLNIDPVNKRCLPFKVDQTSCETNNLINIDVCMDVPKLCQFKISSFKCEILQLSKTKTCQSLNKDKTNGIFYNKLVCASVDESITETFGNKQCYERYYYYQQCNFDKFCFWNDYSCEVKILQNLFIDEDNTYKDETPVKEYEFQNNYCSYDSNCNSYVTVQEEDEGGVTLPGEKEQIQCGLRKKCDYTDQICDNDDDCQDIATTNLVVNYNGTITNAKMQKQKCESKCQITDNIDCIYSSYGKLEILIDEVKETQNCRGKCNGGDQQKCSSNSDCDLHNIGTVTLPDYVHYDCLNYKCSEQTKKSCTYDSDCPDYVKTKWKTQQPDCVARENNYKIDKICKGFVYLELKCQRHFSKALCLYFVYEGCFFDIQQGGCLPIKGNEDKIPNCQSIINQYKPSDKCDDKTIFQDVCKHSTDKELGFDKYCQTSKTKNAICKNSDKTIMPFPKCLSLNSGQREYYICEEDVIQQPDFNCQDIKDSFQDSSPVLCSLAQDYCKYDYTKQICINDDDICNCESSYSQKLCEKCNCNYELLGRCQKLKESLKLNEDGSNKYYLCHEVNLLHSDQKPLVCGMIQDQACKYGDGCEDATHYTCDDLKNYIVSKMACLRCKGFSAYYDEINHICIQLESRTFNKCGNLNQQGCLQKTKGIKCQWKNFQCLEFIKESNSETNCQLFNEDACPEIQDSNYLCWFDRDFDYCVKYDPFKGKCQDLKTESLCELSQLESCQWDDQNNQCKINNDQITTCDKLNKYSCLNQNQILCVWYENQQTGTYECQQAQLVTTFSSCTSPVKITSSIVLLHSPLVCTSIQLNKPCFQDEYLKCREIIITDQITCDSKGINKFACIANTKGKCIFKDNICQFLEKDDIGCLDTLNLENCIFQKKYCKFENNICSNFEVKTLNDIINSNQTFPYSYSVCTALDSQFEQDISNAQSLFYSLKQKRCINVTKRSAFINTCSNIGINRFSCQLKTTIPCRYLSVGQCIPTEKILFTQLQNCFDSYNLNWLSCISLPTACKFLNYKCQSVTLSDTCLQLQNNQSKVNSKVCAKTVDGPCKLDITNQICQLVDQSENFQCSQDGLNGKGCQFFTSGSLCSFINETCIYTYDSSICLAQINEDKCYTVNLPNEFCYFDSNNGCQKVINQNNELSKCSHSFKTNPLTCAQSQDKACFYSNKQNLCIEYTDPDKNAKFLPSEYEWINSVSFNSITCQRYQARPIKAQWKSGACIEIQDYQLTTLTCSSLLNRLACLSILTSQQYCQYINQKCVNQDITKFNQKCNTIIEVNTGTFCQKATDVPCKYNQSTFSCEVVKVGDDILCTTKDIQYLGYNQLACQMNTEQCSFSDGCYKIDVNTVFHYCKNVLEIESCLSVDREGCTLIDNQCKTITAQQYQTIQCYQVQNLMGCVNVQTQNQNCKYSSQQCYHEPFLNDTYLCENQVNVNSMKFCEYSTNVPCQYVAKLNSCQAIQNQSEYSCTRGINSLACFNLTKKDLKCQFYQYCYGPNNSLLDCNAKNESCCNLAQSIESCLFQLFYKCQWINNKCSPFEDQKKSCSQKSYVSRLVCYEDQYEFCTFDSNKYQCYQSNPNQCYEVQSKLQCSRMKNLPCYWNSYLEKCKFKEKDISDTCYSIKQSFGSQRACMNVEGADQMCVFKEGQCSSFQELIGENNCLNNINRYSCLQQTQSQCIWMNEECHIFNLNDNVDCDINLSYLSCLNIIKIHSLCIWQNKGCQKLNFKEEDIISFISYSQINQLVCSQVNDGTSVAYNQNNFLCKEIDQFSCNPSIIGMNKQACFNVNNQTCRWDSQNFKCNYYELKVANIKDCNISGLNAYSCSLLSINKPCGSNEFGCGLVDLQVINCNYPGLNKFACLNIQNYKCTWKKLGQDNQYKCQEIFELDSCLGFTDLVNAQVCSSVEKESCVYNLLTSLCEIPQLDQYDTCEILGLNKIGCSQIENCVYFNNKCQLFNENMNLDCVQAEYAHFNVCKQIKYSKCRYDILNHGCINSKLNDKCSSPGLNQLGCYSINQCVWKESECICKSELNISTSCTPIQSYSKCILLDYCYFEPKKIESNVNITIIEINDEGQCRVKVCDDFGELCNGNTMNGNVCYQVSSGKCNLAKECNEIINPVFSCRKYKIKNIQCDYLQHSNSCINQLPCHQYDKENCNFFAESCIFKTSCTQITCRDYKQEIQCNPNKCTWNSINYSCEEQIECSLINDLQTCQKSKYDSKHCAWIDNQDFCTNIGCRYTYFQSLRCVGVQIIQDVCVLLQDQTCVSCEEIKDSCSCLNNSEYCAYDTVFNQCKSKNCESFNKDACPSNRCYYESQKNICLPICEFRYNSHHCLNLNLSNDCIWLKKEQACSKQVNVEIEIVDPIKDIAGWINNSIKLLILMLWI